MDFDLTNIIKTYPINKLKKIIVRDLLWNSDENYCEDKELRFYKEQIRLSLNPTIKIKSSDSDKVAREKILNYARGILCLKKIINNYNNIDEINDNYNKDELLTNEEILIYQNNRIFLNHYYSDCFGKYTFDYIYRNEFLVKCYVKDNMYLTDDEKNNRRYIVLNIDNNNFKIGKSIKTKSEYINIYQHCFYQTQKSGYIIVDNDTVEKIAVNDYALFDTKAKIIKYTGDKNKIEALMNKYNHETNLSGQEENKYEMPTLDSSIRIGENILNNGNATINDLYMLGFKNVKISTSNIEQSIKQKMLNYIYISIIDLAKLINISPTDLTHNMNLEIYRKRSNSHILGKYSFDLSTNDKKIMLPFNDAVGSLAHEFFHALDGSINEYFNDKVSPYSENFSLNYKPLIKLVNTLKNTEEGKNTNFYENALKLDLSVKRTYFSSNCELLARAFQVYILDKMKEKGTRNDFLNRIVDDVSQITKYGKCSLFPNNDEKQAFNTAFDDFFEDIKELSIFNDFKNYDKYELNKPIKQQIKNDKKVNYQKQTLF